MGPNRCVGDEEAPRDVPGGEALTHELEHFPFATRQVYRLAAEEEEPLAAASLAKLVDELGDQRAGHSGLAVQHSSNRIGKSFGVHVLQEVARGSGAKGIEEIVARSARPST